MTKKAIIIVDLQTAMFDGRLFEPIDGADELVARTFAVIDWARREKHRIAFIRHDGIDGEPLAVNADGWPVWPALGQLPTEPTFGKKTGDAFSNPDLKLWINDTGATDLVILGAQTDRCVSATVTSALAAGFTVTVISDAHSTWSSDDNYAMEIIKRYNADFASQGAKVVETDNLIG